MVGIRGYVFLSCLLTITLIVSVSCTNTVCNVPLTDLMECLPAITGARPPAPTRQCCKVIRRVDLPCLCRYKPQLAKFGANPEAAMAVPKRCGVKSTPRC
ncbi:putative lipid-transfer protein DIR1 [Helianthus annuus]|uniref:Lipid-transfer protein DIR1 n=1 Tax=Helianthus annuus TaxID=4232 RepID=A0A9K3MZQ6_HELAN|nr:putative lipid-transfer protein DIR1 [Helianthus annuus]KAJ0508488.1 putative lipid-transfer protein DIR1 [Helianthus annuus]KAJ0516738.1 putative lipid-transfer protein DIR1 [Helianthus annuus]KAJ0684741.1 putative lipid-transfer protein DIR1 [Helianthus annuus]KAJ0733903.1 putative lipid-transfer protein DIR1 [Helianthus annuus]